jgi:uroporphyrinogen III methyltransferase/synthase
MVQTQPLNGKTIAVTRPSGQAEEEAEIIRQNGGTPAFIPTIEIKPPSNLAPIQQFIEELSQRSGDYVVFMSVNGVTHLRTAAQTLNRLTALEEGLKKAVVVAVGPRTAQELEANQIRVDLIPARFTSEGVLEALSQCNVEGRRVYVPRTSAASPLLGEALEKRGALVREVYVYESSLPVGGEAVEAFFADLSEGKIDAIVFGSSLCAANFFTMLEQRAPKEKVVALINGVAVVAIGPVTAKTLRALGVRVDVVPERHLFGEAIAALVRHWQPHSV